MKDNKLKKFEDLTFKLLPKIKDGDQFIVENESGSGIMTNYMLFDGIYLSYNDIRMSYVESQPPNVNAIELSHCQDGRWEAELDNGKIVCIAAGDLCISTLQMQSCASRLPTNYFYGVSLYIDFDAAANNTFLAAYNIDLDRIRQLVKDDPIRVYKSNERLNHIFYEFYYAKTHFSKAYLKIKALELLLFVSTIDWTMENEKRLYIARNNVNTVKNIHALIVGNLDKHYTIEWLAKTYDLSQTNLKVWFKEIYGESIYAYTKKIKLEHAKARLKNSNLSIAEIGLEIGYENPAKFSTAFKKAFGKSPSKYFV